MVDVFTQTQCGGDTLGVPPRMDDMLDRARAM